jgi:hypothetical protein
VTGYSLDTRSSVDLGPVFTGAAQSGVGTVVFGTANPGLTAAVSNVTSSPWLFAIVGVVAVAGLWFALRK